MTRSRSSFELGGAIATAASLSGETEERPRLFEGVTLVSFGTSATPAPSVVAIAAPSPRARVMSPEPPASDPPDSIEARRPPKLPDLSGVVSPAVRCEKIAEWIGEATGAADVFLADGNGLPIAGAIVDAEALLAGAGLVAAAVAQLAASIPGRGTPLFELHVGEGPFFQLIGFEANAVLYLVGLTRREPLTPRQAHAIRLACRHALGDTPGTPE